MAGAVRVRVVGCAERQVGGGEGGQIVVQHDTRAGRAERQAGESEGEDQEEKEVAGGRSMA